MASTTLNVEPTALASMDGAVEQRVVGVRVGELLVVLRADAADPDVRVEGGVAGHGEDLAVLHVQHHRGAAVGRRTLPSLCARSMP